MRETVIPWKFSVEGESGLDWRGMSALERAVDGPAIEVVAKATRRRFGVAPVSWTVNS